MLFELWVLWTIPSESRCLYKAMKWRALNKYEQEHVTSKEAIAELRGYELTGEGLTFGAPRRLSYSLTNAFDLPRAKQ